MKECSKSVMRRLADSRFATRYFVGDGVDIGAGPDPLAMYAELFPQMGGVKIWDLAQGDAQLMDGVADDTFDFAHSSHCLEHLNDPREGLKNWLRVVAPGGHLIVTVPDEDMYEQGRFPSANNADHKWTFTIYKETSWSAKSQNIVDMIRALGPQAEVVKIEALDAGYRHAVPRFDQTLTPIAECAIELIIRKRPMEEAENGGRYPDDDNLDPKLFTLLTGYQLKHE